MFGIEADKDGGQDNHQEPSDAASNVQLPLEVFPHTHGLSVLAWTLTRSLSHRGDVTSWRHVCIRMRKHVGANKRRPAHEVLRSPHQPPELCGAAFTGCPQRITLPGREVASALPSDRAGAYVSELTAPRASPLEPAHTGACEQCGLPAKACPADAQGCGCRALSQQEGWPRPRKRLQPSTTRLIRSVLTRATREGGPTSFV